MKPQSGVTADWASLLRSLPFSLSHGRLIAQSIYIARIRLVVWNPLKRPQPVAPPLSPSHSPPLTRRLFPALACAMAQRRAGMVAGEDAPPSVADHAISDPIPKVDWSRWDGFGRDEGW